MPQMDLFGPGAFEQNFVPTDFLKLHEMIVDATGKESGTMQEGEEENLDDDDYLEESGDLRCLHL